MPLNEIHYDDCIPMLYHGLYSVIGLHVLDTDDNINSNTSQFDHTAIMILRWIAKYIHSWTKKMGQMKNKKENTFLDIFHQHIEIKW